jgi:hypothetical protein
MVGSARSDLWPCDVGSRTRRAFTEVFLEDTKLFYRPEDALKTEGVLPYESS